MWRCLGVPCAITVRTKRADLGDDVFKAGFFRCGARFQRLAHCAQMFRHGATASANDLCATIPCHHGVIGHQFRRAVVTDMTVHIFGNAGVAFGNNRLGRGLIRKSLDRAQQIRCARSAIRAKGNSGFGRLLTKATISRDVTPIIVRPAVSKLIVPTHGKSTCEKASAAARCSSGDEMVSSQSTSAPPSFKPIA